MSVNDAVSGLRSQRDLGGVNLKKTVSRDKISMFQKEKDLLMENMIHNIKKGLYLDQYNWDDYSML
jgi:hypothetical protein